MSENKHGSGWTTLQQIQDGQLVEFADGRFGVKTGRNRVQFVRTAATELAGGGFSEPTTMSNTMMERAQVLPRDVVELLNHTTFNPRIDEHTPKLVQTLAGKPLAEAAQSLACDYGALLRDVDLPRTISFFDEQLNVESLVSEAERAWNEDRPCKGGDARMARRLARIIRAYHDRINLAFGAHEEPRTNGSEATPKVDLLQIGQRWGSESLAFTTEQAWSEIQAFVPDVVRKEDVQALVTRAWALSASVPRRAAEHHASLVKPVDVAPQPENDDGAIPIGIGPVNPPVGETARTSAHSRLADEMTRIRLDLGAETERRISAVAIDQWFIENGGEALPERMRPLMAGFCRFVARTAAADLIAARDQQIGEVERTLTETQKANTRIAEEADRLTGELAQARQHDADRDSKLDRTTRALADVQRALEQEKLNKSLGSQLAVHQALDGAGVPQNGTLLDRIEWLLQQRSEVDKRDAAITALYQDIRSIVGPVDVTDADREAVTEEDAANGPDAREYYAERRALMRVIRERENAKELADVRAILRAAGFELGSQPTKLAVNRLIVLYKREHHDLTGIRSILKQRGKIQDNPPSDILGVVSRLAYFENEHAQEAAELADIRRRIHAGAEPGDTAKCVQELIANQRRDEEEDGDGLVTSDPPSCWFPVTQARISLPVLKKLTELVNEPVDDEPVSDTCRRNRITRIARAAHALSIAHGMSAAEFATDEPEDTFTGIESEYS